MDPVTPRALGRSRPLAHDLYEAMSERIARGPWAVGHKLPTEGALAAEFGVSRTVVREALSRLQAAGRVTTRHGVGTFVVGAGGSDGSAGFRVEAHQLATLRDVIALLELRIGLETEAAALAAVRRTDDQLRALRAALDDFRDAVEQGRDAVEADFRFHREIARATHNEHFEGLLATLGVRAIPRARLEPDRPADPAQAAARQAYLRRVNAEHDSILDAIANRDPEAARAAMRTHLANSRERRRRSQPGEAGA